MEVSGLKNKEVGMGLNRFLCCVADICVLLVFYEVTSLHPFYFKGMVFPLVPLNFQ